MKDTIKKIPLLLLYPFIAFWQWFQDQFKEEFELTVWFHTETTVSSDGLKTVTRTKRTYVLTGIDKKTPTHIVGKDNNGNFFEICTVQPFDYTITKTK